MLGKKNFSLFGFNSSSLAAERALLIISGYPRKFSDNFLYSLSADSSNLNKKHSYLKIKPIDSEFEVFCYDKLF